MWGKSPLEVIHRKKYKKWKRLDYGLAEAYKIFKDERCPHCGTHIWHAYSEDQNIKIDIEEIKCESCVVLDEHNEKEKDKKAGVTPTIKISSYFPDDIPVPTRSDWFQDLQRKEELKKVR